jgi:SAM-dependent methyltransferase
MLPGVFFQRSNYECTTPMNLSGRSPPYFERLLAGLAAADPGARAAFGRHVHWGYWSEPSQAGTGYEEYGRAAEDLCHALLDCAELGDGQTTLDVGCGFGGTIACLNERYARQTLIGVNIDEAQLRRAGELVVPLAGNTVRWVAADAAQLPLADESLDRVLAVECVFHFDRPRFFAEVGRVLRSGGNLTLSDFVPDERAVPYFKLMESGGNEAIRATYGVVDVTWSTDRYRKLAAAHGLALGDVVDITAHTLPTYDFLRKCTETWTDRAEVEQFTQATGMLEKASRRGFVGYQILRFDKNSIR